VFNEKSQMKSHYYFREIFKIHQSAIILQMKAAMNKQSCLAIKIAD